MLRGLPKPVSPEAPGRRGRSNAFSCIDGMVGTSRLPGVPPLLLRGAWHARILLEVISKHLETGGVSCRKLTLYYCRGSGKIVPQGLARDITGKYRFRTSAGGSAKDPTALTPCW